jgi:16S rRNA (cytosine1402-N4)-methyltransferase
LTAAELVNTLSFEDLSDILWRYGEERYSRKIARAILRNRPMHTTTELADLIIRTIGYREHSIHPATRTFQALRIVVNHELDSLQSVLPDVVAALRSGGRAAIISFHSLEDRIVKQFFQKESQDCICPPKQPVCTCNHKASLKIVHKRIRPSEEEIQSNPRARSAVLRVIEKI